MRLLASFANLADQILEGREPDIVQVTRPPLIVHESTAILRTLDLFRKTPVHTALVVDEFGALQGLVTRTDLLETVAGDLPKINAPARPKVTQREDGSFLIDASTPFPDAMRCIGMIEAPAGDYVTVAVLSSRSCMSCRSRAIMSPGANGASRSSTWTADALTRSWLSKSQRPENRFAGITSTSEPAFILHL